jgi:hypothetical protein
MNNDILCTDEPLTNAERLELWRRKRWCLWLDEPSRNRDRTVLWEWLRLTWGNGSPIGRQAE